MSLLRVSLDGYIYEIASTRRQKKNSRTQTFAVDLAVLLGLSGRLQALAALCASEAVLMPRLCGGRGGGTGTGTEMDRKSFRHGRVEECEQR